MKLRLKSKLLLTATLGLAFSAIVAHAQLMVNVSQRATFGPFVGGINNSVTNNGSTNINQVITTGTPLASQFNITYDPITGPSMVTLNTGTLTTTNFIFNSTITPQNYFSALAVAIETDFDGNGSYDLTQNYTLSLSPFTSPNGLTGVNYMIVPQQFFGSVMINGSNYGYASVVSNNQGTLFDGSSTTAAIQFQFLATPVPEPSTYALAGVVALGGIVALRRRRNKSNSPLALAA
ncbi:PEP-CTERM sorting domain-containing protein [Oleiharenicola lentus]|uniref:PEP-CTERM sorting domain-containing protein n=1 Tax=Oleiharenicola lentus TaxID=2508720 RepID=UPI003F6820D3